MVFTFLNNIRYSINLREIKNNNTPGHLYSYSMFSLKSRVFFSDRQNAFNAQKMFTTWVFRHREISSPQYTILGKLKLHFNNRLEMKKQNNIRFHSTLMDIFTDDKTNLHDNNSYIKKLSSKNLNKYYLRNRNNSVIFTRKFLFNYFTMALHIFMHVLKMKGNILIINTNPELSKLAYHIKKNIYNQNFKLLKNNIFFSDCGWTNGTLTNSNKVFNKIKTFRNFYMNYNTFLLENNIIFPAYTKLKKNYKGFIPNYSNNDKITSLHIKNDFKPDLIVFLSITNCKPIIKEANSLNIPIIGFVDNNSFIDDIQYPIFGNTRFYLLIWFFFTLITKITNYTYGRSKKTK
jgi:ribosomal protein S2